VQADDRETAVAEQARLCDMLGLQPGTVVQSRDDRWMARAHPADPDDTPA
jgi:hypothetical protein